MSAPIFVPVIIILVALPLILEKVPPNGLYGFRTPKTRSSPQVWYPANRMSGIYLALAGVAMLILTFALRGSDYSPEESATSALLIVLVPLTAAVIASFVYLRKL
jgi:uncharacterized membrane protein